MTLTANQRKLAYAALVVLNAALIALSNAGVMQASSAHMLQMASMLVAMFMKELGAPDPAPAPAAPPPDGAK